MEKIDYAFLIATSLIMGFLIGGLFVSSVSKTTPEQFEIAKRSCVQVEYVEGSNFKCKTIEGD
jgi:hypothetical protein